MVRALKRIAVEVHNVVVHDRDLMRISALSGHDYTTRFLCSLHVVYGEYCLRHSVYDATFSPSSKPPMPPCVAIEDP